MKEKSEISQQDFENLLGWFSVDREKAGEQYEQIRQGLIRFFRFRGCDEPEFLTDETINRVAGKLSTFSFNENVKTITYFYSFASKIYLEDRTRRKKKETLNDAKDYFAESAPAAFEDGEERNFDCLEDCLAKLPAEERDLIIQYYSKEKKAKSELRMKLAERFNLKVTALHTRVHRLRISLRKCVENCLAEKCL